MQNEVTEGALGRPPAAGIRTIVIFLFIPAAVRTGSRSHGTFTYGMCKSTSGSQGSHLIVGSWLIRHLIRFFVRRNEVPPDWVKV
jgi:hypothetical protein